MWSMNYILVETRYRTNLRKHITRIYWIKLIICTDNITSQILYLMLFEQSVSHMTLLTDWYSIIIWLISDIVWQTIKATRQLDAVNEVFN